MELFKEVKYLEKLYTETPVQLYENLEYNTRDIIKLADFYSLSRYMSGMKDDLGRDKGFYNIVNFRVTIAKTATEFDIKDFVATADDTNQWVQTMLFNQEAYEWMKRSRFSKFLNKFAYVRPKYGGVIYKKTEQDGDLKIEVCDWRNVLTDQVDVLGSPIIEKHYLTALDLHNKRDVWKNVDEAIEYLKKKQKQKDEAVNRVEVLEVTGILSENGYREVEGKQELKEDTYSLQKHFLLYCEDEDPITLYSTKPKELGYRYLAWEEVAGRGLGRGVIEEAEEGQVWVNDSVLKQKNTMDIAGRVLIKTDSESVADNILEVDDGKIFKLNKGEDMVAMQLAPAAIGQYTNMVEMWNQQLDKATSTFDANTGETMPSGTPYSQTALLNQVAQRPFAFRQEEAAIELEEMFNEWVVPHITKKIAGEHILVSSFDDETREVIDESFANYEQRRAAKTAAFAALNQSLATGSPLTPDIETFTNQVREGALRSVDRGEKRTIKIPKDFFKDFTGKMTLNISNEQQNKSAILQSLSQILTTVSSSYNPQTGQFMILEDPVLAKIFGSIVETANIGLSPVELGLGGKKKREPVAQPQAQGTPVAPELANEQPA